LHEFLIPLLREVDFFLGRLDPRLGLLVERLQHIDAIRKLGDVDDAVRLLPIGNTYLLDAPTYARQSLSISRLQAHLNAGKFLTQRIPCPFWEATRNLSRIALPTDLIQV